MKETINRLNANIQSLQISKIKFLRALVERYLMPLHEITQRSSHHHGESALEHVLIVVDALTHILLVIKEQTTQHNEELANFVSLEQELAQKLKPEQQAVLRVHLQEKIEGLSRETLLFYAAVLHDIGKIDLIAKYEQNLEEFKQYSKHHSYGEFMINNYEDAINELQQYKEQLKLKAKTKPKLNQEIQYLTLIEQFLKENQELLSTVRFTKKQLNHISKLIGGHHIFSNSFNEYKKTGKLGKGTKKSMRKLQKENLLLDELLLFYSDVVACLHVANNQEVKNQLLSFMLAAIDFAM